MRRSKSQRTPCGTRITRGCAAATPGRACATPLFLVVVAACGFPRPRDIGDDFSGDSGGSTTAGIAIHVSPSGDDASDGLMLPVRTLKHAIGLAAANPQATQIILATGTYTKVSGETFPYVVPANVTIVGPAGGGAVLVGSKAEPGMTVDAGGLQDLDLQDFTIAITATGTANLKNIRVLSSAIAIQAETNARLVIDHLDITGAADACAFGIVLNGNAALTASTVATRALGTSLLAKDRSTVVLASANISGGVSCTKAAISIVSNGVFAVSESLLDGGSSGIEIIPPSINTPAQATLRDVIVRGMDMSALNVGNAIVQMTGGELSHTRTTSLSVIGGICSLMNVSLLNSNEGFYSQDASLTMRGCTVSGNAVGGDLGLGAMGDLGTTMDLGNNVFKNSGVGLLVEGENGTQPVQAVGNTWKPVQGADTSGKYGLGTVVPGPVLCDPKNNFCIQISDESIQL
jgi:hypothetical protein